MSTGTLTRVSGHQYGLRSYARVREDAAGTITHEGSSEPSGRTGVAEPQEARDMRSGRFLPGHRLWASRSSSGPKPRFADGEALWAACLKYFEWVEDNPLYEMQLVTWRGRATQVPVPKMRSMTKANLCLFLQIERSTWNGWKRDRPDLESTIERAETVIWVWQFNGAAAGLLDEWMVIRQLGIGRKTEPGFCDSTRARTRASRSRDPLTGG